jgi:hypothetical protein
LALWSTLLPFLDPEDVSKYQPAVVRILGHSFQLKDASFKDFLPYLHTSYLESHPVEAYLRATWLPKSLDDFYDRLHRRIFPNDWNPKWSVLPVGVQASYILARAVQAKRLKPLYFFRAEGFPFSLWAEYICVTTPPPFPHFALNLGPIRAKWCHLLDDPHPRLLIQFDPKPLWDFSSGSRMLALHTVPDDPKCAAVTYEALESGKRPPIRPSGKLGSLISAISSVFGGGGGFHSNPRQPPSYPDYKRNSTKVYWADVGLYGWLTPGRTSMTLELIRQ